MAAALTAGCAPDPPSAVVGVEVDGCGQVLEAGSGSLIDHGIVLTAAHTLRGAQSVTVSNGTESAEATIVGFDPELDLAYLLADIDGRPFEVDSSGLVAGDRGKAWVVRDGRAVPIDVEIVRRIELHTEDIYVEGETVRPGIELAADIEPGDSGGAVIVDGRLVGVLWARSRESDGRAYAIDPARGAARIDEQRRSGDLGDVDISRC